MSEERDARLGRRRLLQAGAGVVGAGLVGTGATGTAAAQSGPFGGWMGDVGNYDGVVDATGRSEVTVTVGASGNGGNFAFGPAAVQVDPGTTVLWEWNGKGGQHNVVAEEGGDFESELTAEAGITFEQTFESEGVVKYYCTPHRALGMKGVVVVGSVPEGAEVVSGGGGSSGGDGGAGLTMSLVVGGSLVAAFLSPLVFGLILMLRDRTGGQTAETGAEHGGVSHED